MEEIKPLLTISGPPAAGTSTLSEYLSEELDFELINGGDIFRRIAADRNLTLAQLTELSEEDDTIDKELDERLKQIIQDHLTGERVPEGEGLIVESRLAGWHAEDGADVSIYLDAPLDIRAERISDRDESVEDLASREMSEAKRYKQYYDIDVTDVSIYDLVIDTSKVSKDEMKQQVRDELEETL